MTDSSEVEKKEAESTETTVKKEADVGNGNTNAEKEEYPKDSQEEGQIEGATEDEVEEKEGNGEETDVKTPVIQAAPQATDYQPQDSMDDLVDCKLSPLDAGLQRQSIKDALAGKGNFPAPSLFNNAVSAVKSVVNPKSNNANHVHFSENHKSSLHADDDADYQNSPHNPNNHESALESDPSTGGDGTVNNMLNKFRRKTQRLTPGQGKKSHSHPRKSPFRSEIARLREQQRLEREKTPSVNPEGGKAGAQTNSKSRSIAATTAPPESASFAKQTAKLKHSILQSLGDFLTGAFADDEELSGSYFSQDLLDQIAANDPSIKGVWLQAKSLNDSHVKQLCEVLIRNKVITEVWLPSNLITDVGAGHIAHMLKFNHSIKELFLGENDIGPKGAAALASALARGNNTLVALGLGDNHIGVEGAGAFAAALRHNHTLSSLDIKNNGIPRYSSIRGLLHKMLEFNAADPGDESLVVGLQEELTSLISNLPPDMAEDIVLQAEEALKMAMLCRKRGDVVGAAEAEGIFIRICTTGEAPVDPPEEMAYALAEHRKEKAHPKKSKKQQHKPCEPDRLDELNNQLKSLQYNDRDNNQQSEEIKGKEETFEEVSKEGGRNAPTAEVGQSAEAEVSTLDEKASGDVVQHDSNEEK